MALYCFSVVILILLWTFTCRFETMTPREKEERDIAVSVSLIYCNPHDAFSNTSTARLIL